MSRTIAYKRGKRQPWIKARSTGGHCFTVTFDKLEKVLHDIKALDPDETVERFEVNEIGVTVFFVGVLRSLGARQRV